MLNIRKIYKKGGGDYWMLDAGYRMWDTGCGIQDAGYISGSLYQCKNKSVITNSAKITDAIPFAVMKAIFTLLRSAGLTILCW